MLDSVLSEYEKALTEFLTNAQSSRARSGSSIPQELEDKIVDLRALLQSVSISAKKIFPTITMAKFHKCNCQEFSYVGKHASVQTMQVELQESCGVAISYTWGEVDREYRYIGHKCEDPSKLVRLCLGAE